MEGGGRFVGAREGGPPPLGRRFWPTLSAEIVGWVTAGELPAAPPPPLPLDAEVPVALWRDDKVAAVVSIAHTGPTDYLGKGLPFRRTLYIARHLSSGWTVNEGSSGSTWPVAYGDRPEGDLPALVGAGGEEPPDAPAALFAEGVAPRGMDHVEIDVGDRRVTVPVEPVTGAFVVRVSTNDWAARAPLPFARHDERLVGTPDPAEVARRLDWLGIPRPPETPPPPAG